jgi:hypothetical protein
MATAATTKYDELSGDVRKMVGLSSTGKNSATGIKHFKL